MIGPHLQLFKSLNSRGVEYLLIGGVAAIAYGIPRTTKDIDIFIESSVENATACLAALKDIGLGTAELTTPEKLAGTEVTIFKDIVRVDVLTRVTGLQFDAAWRRKVFFEVRGVHIPAICKEDLIQSKKAAGRETDLEDVKVLETIVNKDK